MVFGFVTFVLFWCGDVLVGSQMEFPAIAKGSRTIAARTWPLPPGQTAPSKASRPSLHAGSKPQSPKNYKICDLECLLQWPKSSKLPQSGWERVQKVFFGVCGGETRPSLRAIVLETPFAPFPNRSVFEASGHCSRHSGSQSQMTQEWLHGSVPK